jgi:uncharacterized protein YukE
MTRRQSDWHLVGHDDDPVPASRWDVDTVERQMRGRAEEAADMRTVLQRLADLDGWRGKAAESFAERAEDVLGDLGKVEDRYTSVAVALAAWEEDVSTARDQTWKAVQAAEEADQAVRSNPEHIGAGEPPADQAARDARRSKAEADLDSARSAMQAAVSVFEEAAERARSRIDDAADVWDDGWWGNFKGWVREHAELIYSIVKVLEIVAAVLGAVLLVLAIVASAPLALILAALAGGVLLVGGHSLLAAADTGKADWGDVAWSVAGLAATLIGGKAATSAARGLKALVPTMSARVVAQTRTAALTRLVGSSRVQFENALRITNPRNNLARWTQALRDAAAAEGRAAGRQIDDVLGVQPSRLQAVVAQDRKLAQLHTGLSRLRTLGPTADEIARMEQIQQNLWVAVGANTYGTVTWAKGLPGNVADTWKLVENPPWSTRPVD